MYVKHTEWKNRLQNMNYLRFNRSYIVAVLKKPPSLVENAIFMS